MGSRMHEWLAGDGGPVSLLSPFRGGLEASTAGKNTKLGHPLFVYSCIREGSWTARSAPQSLKRVNRFQPVIEPSLFVFCSWTAGPEQSIKN